MEKFSARLYDALQNELTAIRLSGESLPQQLETSIHYCKKAMAKLKAYIFNYNFESQEEEIRFFKHIKPQFYSQYIYYVSVYNYTMNRPIGGREVVEVYIQQEQQDLKRFFDHNHSFYQYYRSGTTQMDPIYFTRGGFSLYSGLEDFEEDERYSTSHDYKLSKIIANEQYQDYLLQELAQLESANRELSTVKPLAGLQWTGNQVDLVELIYALSETGVFNHGQTDIKMLMEYFQMAFQVDVKDYYHKYQDIVRRKKDRSAFLERLKLNLLRRIEQKYDADHAA